jgi:hypothetical protein
MMGASIPRAAMALAIAVAAASGTARADEKFARGAARRGTRRACI